MSANNRDTADIVFAMLAVVAGLYIASLLLKKVGGS